MARDLTGVGVGEVGEDGDGEFVVQVARNVDLEALPGATVIENFAAVLRDNVPTETVVAGIGLAVQQLRRSPHLFETGGVEKLFGIEGCVPFREIQDREVKG